jgi:hypothetical protein
MLTYGLLHPHDRDHAHTVVRTRALLESYMATLLTAVISF